MHYNSCDPFGAASYSTGTSVSHCALGSVIPSMPAKGAIKRKKRIESGDESCIFEKESKINHLLDENCTEAHNLRSDPRSEVSDPTQPPKRSFPSLYTLDTTSSSQLFKSESNYTFLVSSHQTEISSLRSSYETLFNSWSYQLHLGFHLLLYGYGSKRNLIKSFFSSSSLQKRYQIFVIDGTHAELSLETVMNSLLIHYVQPYMKYIQSKKTIRKNTDRAVLLVERISQITRLSLSGVPNLPKPLMLVVLNMDAIWIRQEKFQSFLSLFAKPETQCRIISCIDHVSSPLLLSNSNFPRWKWICHDVTTFAPYTKEELSVVKETLQGSISSDTQHVSTLTVLSNLTINARKIYALISKVQLFFASIDEMNDNQNDDIDPALKQRIQPSTPKRNLLSMITCNTPISVQSPKGSILSGLNIDSIKSPNIVQSVVGAPDNSSYGLTFAQFYQLAMENFLTSNEISFRTQLSEFFDHKILSSKKLSGGAEVLYLPFPSYCIQDILSGLDSM